MIVLLDREVSDGDIFNSIAIKICVPLESAGELTETATESEKFRVVK
jgi:hypothetical protein